MRNVSLVVILAVSFLSASCGGGVDEGFTGTWRGTTTITGPASSLSIAGSLVLSADGDSLRVSTLCPDGSGSIQVPGEGRTLSWAGDVACPIPSQSCPSGVLRYNSATLALEDGGEALSVAAAGSISGCGSPFAVRVTFSGVRQ